MEKPNVQRQHQISEEERQERAEQRLVFNKELVKKYPVGSILKKIGKNGALKGIRQRIIEVKIDPNYFDRPIFILYSMKNGKMKPVMGDDIEAYKVID
jgi:hypothetical protein